MKRSQRRSSNGGAGRVGRALVVAGDDGAGSPEAELDLGGAENVAGGMEAEGDAADQALLAIGEGLEGSAGCLAKADAHDAERLRRRQDGGIVRPGMVAMAMGDDGALDGARRDR